MTCGKRYEKRIELEAEYESALLDHCDGSCPACEMGPVCRQGRAIRDRWMAAVLRAAKRDVGAMGSRR